MSPETVDIFAEPAETSLEPVQWTPPPRRSSFISRILRRRYLVLAAVGAVLIGAAVWRLRPSASPTSEFETVAVRRGELTQTVTATGAVKAASEFNLNFQAAGLVADVRVEKGSVVKVGELLASLEGTDYTLAAERAAAALLEAEANLNKAAAGASPEEIKVKEAALSEAEARVGQASTTLASAVRDSALKQETAVLSVREAQSARDQKKQAVEDDARAKNQTVQKALDAELTDAYATAVTMATALTDSDNILGVDNTTANDAFEGLLAASDPALLQPARDAYKVAREAKTALEKKLAELPAAPESAAVEALAGEAKKDLMLTTTALAKTRAVLDATTPSSQLTQSDLNTKKLGLDGDRSAVTSKLSVLAADLSAAALARIDRDASAHADAAALTAAELALEREEHNRAVTKLSVETAVVSDQAALSVSSAARDQAAAALALLRAKLRETDRAPLEAAVAVARAAAASAAADVKKTQITAPTDGIVTDVAVARGELAAGSSPAIAMLSTHYEVDADVPEADIVKLVVGETADVTLDALGSDQHFAGTVVAINPAETVIQDIVYYKVRVVLSQSPEEIKPGMTANLSVVTNRRANVLLVPLRAVRDDRSARYVEVVTSQVTRRRPVTLGLRGDEGLVEITDGLAEGEVVVTGVKEKK